jgi:hypothetical protein
MGKTVKVKRKAILSASDLRAQEWAKKNKWFGKDQEKTAYALGIHERLVRIGIDPKSAEYYKKVDALLPYFETTAALVTKIKKLMEELHSVKALLNAEIDAAMEKNK